MQYKIERETHLLVLVMIFCSGLLLALRPDFFLSLKFPCVLKQIFGIKCPFCGMTKDFFLMSRGAMPIYNPFSLAAAVMIFLVYPLAFLFAFLLKKERLKLEYAATRNIFFIVMISMFIINNLK
jgi:hypothetical protein